MTIEEQAKFLEEHPDWSPMLDDSGRVIGIASPIVNMTWLFYENLIKTLDKEYPPAKWSNDLYNGY